MFLANTPIRGEILNLVQTWNLCVIVITSRIVLWKASWDGFKGHSRFRFSQQQTPSPAFLTFSASWTFELRHSNSFKQITMTWTGVIMSYRKWQKHAAWQVMLWSDCFQDGMWLAALWSVFWLRANQTWGKWIFLLNFLPNYRCKGSHVTHSRHLVDPL